MVAKERKITLRSLLRKGGIQALDGQIGEELPREIADVELTTPDHEIRSAVLLRKGDGSVDVLLFDIDEPGSSNTFPVVTKKLIENDQGEWIEAPAKSGCLAAMLLVVSSASCVALL